ncbi:MAG: dephospho-CoA kinase [Muribaculaceae bacterium]|nr:dephospho-CoA kinase [Muribaculaceae bacterium]MCM1493976.1 dephospho-CoA kinase [Muribaculaceae bacterium]
MRFIGITGGVGAGKSEILNYLKKRPHTRVMLADEIARGLMEPQTECYIRLREEFAGEEIYLPGGEFDRERLAAVIFGDEKKRARLNAVVHPAVKAYVEQQAALERARGELKLLVLEAALLIEEHYDKICDELWYIDACESVRRARLKASRGYSDERIDGIFASQLKDNVYRSVCTVVIDNNGALLTALEQVEGALRR